MEAVDHNEAPDYYILIKDPMGMSILLIERYVRDD